MVGPLVCHATGRPEPTIIWKREDGKAFHVKSTKRMGKGTSMYYVSKEGGGRGSAKCLLLLTWEEGGAKGSCLRNNILDFFLR